MPAGRPTKYTNRFETTVSVEKGLWDVAKRLNVTLAEAVSYGLQVLIEAEIRSTKGITAETIEDYLEVKKTSMHQWAQIRAREEAAEEQIQKLICDKKSSSEEIRIYNIADNEYQIIKRSEFSPLIHRMVTKGDSE